MDSTTIWSRRAQQSKLSLSTSGNSQADGSAFPPRNNASYARRVGGESPAVGGRGSNPFNSAVTPGGAGGLISPGSSSASTAFGLGSGAFASFGAKTPKTTGNPFESALGFGGKTPGAEKNTKEGGLVGGGAKVTTTADATPKPTAATATPTTSTGASLPQHALRSPWVFWFRPPISKANGYIEYDKTLHPIAEASTVEEFFAVYTHLKRASDLPLVSDYHFFRKGVRPIWEDEENRKGGKWVVRLKKGVSTRFWEDLLLAIVGDEFADAGEEVCGAVLSVRNGEDILSVWVQMDGGKVVKIRETMKRVLAFRPDTKVEWKSHDSSIQQRHAMDDIRRERAAAAAASDKRSKLGGAGGNGGGNGGFGGGGSHNVDEQK